MRRFVARRNESSRLIRRTIAPEPDLATNSICSEADRQRRFCDIPASAFAQPTPKGASPSLPGSWRRIFELGRDSVSGGAIADTEQLADVQDLRFLAMPR